MGELQCEMISPIDMREWDALVEQSPAISPFIRKSWLTILSEVFEIPIQCVAIFEKDEFILGAITGEKRKGPFLLSTPLPLSSYTAIIPSAQYNLPTPRREKALRMLFEALETRLHFYSSTMHPSVKPSVEFQRSHWKWTAQRTSVLQMTSVEKVWSGFNQSLRRKIRRVEELGCRVIATQNADSIIALLCESYERQEIKLPFQSKTLLKLTQQLLAAGLLKAYRLESSSGEVLAVRAVTWYRHAMYDMLAGMSAEGATLNASHFLVWKIIEQAAKDGFTNFDFMGLNSPGPSEFKKSFGGDVIEYQQMTFHRSKAIESLGELKNYFIRRKRGIRT